MRSMRHPNPLIDVRRPRRGEKVGVNPPGFIWKPIEGASEYRLEVCRSRKFDDASLQSSTVTGRTMFLLPEPLEPGRWFWRWGALGKWSETFAFEVLADAAPVSLGTAEELASRVASHPRMMYVAHPPPGVSSCDVSHPPLVPNRPRGPEGRAGVPHVSDALRARIVERAEKLLAEPQEMPEPPFLPLRSEDYNKAHVIWRKAMNDSRAFCAGAHHLAFAYLVTGDRRFAEAVAKRLDSLSRWNPDGSTTIQHNDEPHMSVINWCPFAFDWTFDALDAGRRERFVAHLARRADNTLAHLERLRYEINPISNHAGRMLPFLGNCALALAGHHERAGVWLRYVLEQMVSMYPAWGAEAGGWAQGFSYGGAYVRWGLEFVFALRTALGVDLYRKPFFRSHGRFYALCLPPYAWQNPFGDGGERDFAKTHAALITRHLAAMTGDEAVARYAAQVESGLKEPIDADPLVVLAEADAVGVAQPPPAESSLAGAGVAQAPLGENPRGEPSPAAASSLSSHPRAGAPHTPHTSECFADVGWVAMRRNLDDPEDDIALVLKSSPYGPISHSHGDQNSIALSAWGKPLLIRTGYYTGYGSPHHHNWIRQTKAHNSVTVGGVGQWLDCFDAVGRIAAFKRGREFAYACGDASAAYGDRMTRFHRHVLFIGRRYFLIVDDLASAVGTTFDWHLHSFERMEMDESHKHVRIAREGATLDVDFVTDWDLRFTRTDAFDPPNDDVEQGPYPAQWHFRATTVPVSRRARVGMLLIPNRTGNPDAFRVERSCEEGRLRARVEHAGVADEFLIATADAPIRYDGTESPALALWVRGGKVKLAIARR